jgi:pimeloyl-ACP methyl ester carboxylesterase
MPMTGFQLRFGDYVLHGDSYATPCRTVVLHGAGKSNRQRFERLRAALNAHGRPSASFDFIGHGDTGGSLAGSSLKDRTNQASAVIRHACHEPLTLIGASMSGYTAIKLTEKFDVDHLILLVPAVYTPDAYGLHFGPEFSTAIRSEGSWRTSDAFAILRGFTGNLLTVAAESDHVIPREVIETIHASAANARTRRLHVVPGSQHLSLFPTEKDFRRAMALIRETCRAGGGDRRAATVLPGRPASRGGR